MFEVQSGVEMPEAIRNYNREAKYPFSAMGVGQSFTIPAELAPKQGKRTLLQASSNWRKKTGLPHKFRVHQHEDGSIGVWRIA
jgi:hypothetical protein